VTLSALIPIYHRFSAILLALAFACNCVWAQAPQRDDWRTPFDTAVQTSWLFQVLPQAERFSEKQGDPPVFRAYRSDSGGGETLVGFAFLSSDLPPEEKGYSAPVAMLIGMDVNMVITGLKVLDYRDSYRYSRGDLWRTVPFSNSFPAKRSWTSFVSGKTSMA